MSFSSIILKTVSLLVPSAVFISAVFLLIIWSLIQGEQRSTRRAINEIKEWFSALLFRSERVQSPVFLWASLPAPPLPHVPPLPPPPSEQAEAKSLNIPNIQRNPDFSASFCEPSTHKRRNPLPAVPAPAVPTLCSILVNSGWLRLTWINSG